MRAFLSEAAVFRVLASLVAAERANLGAGRAWDAAGWTPATSLGADGLALDSLELMAAAEVAGRFFRLHESGDENRLLAETTLGGWSRLIAQSFARPDDENSVDGFTFATSGTTGLPKLCRQPMATLHREASFWGERFAGRQRVVQTVPGHHIYGFLFTVLLPEQAGWPVLDARMLPPAALRAALRPGDLLVGYPAGLRALAPAAGPLPGDVQAVSATSGLAAGVHRALLEDGLTAVTDVYGSTETAGIAWRNETEAPFTLLPRWRRGDTGETLTEIATGRACPLPDRVEWRGDRLLEPAERRDGAVQVAGVNVVPARVEAELRTHPLLADCRVFLDAAMPEPRLRAVVMPAPGHDPEQVVSACERWCRRRFTAPERPVSFEVRPAPE